jgi:hypothetical protein
MLAAQTIVHRVSTWFHGHLFHSLPNCGAVEEFCEISMCSPVKVKLGGRSWLRGWLCGLMVLLVFCGAGRACLWINGTTLEGNLTRTGGPNFAAGAWPLAEGGIFTRETAHAQSHAEFLRAVAAMPLAKVLDLSREMTEVPADWPPELNAAVEPIFAGEISTSAEMLAALHAKYPDNYYVCANLAVTSELAGNDAEALQWVEKALRIKPDAHSGTEWMHAAVLRAKLALAKDPAWLETRTISGIPPGEVPADFSLTEGPRKIELEEIQHALLAHLVPRILFVKGPDRIVAAMLTELARVEARADSVEAGIAMLKIAAEHGAVNTGPLLKEWEWLVTRRKMLYWWKGLDPGWWLLLAVAGILGYFVWRYAWRRRGPKAVAPQRAVES